MDVSSKMLLRTDIFPLLAECAFDFGFTYKNLKLKPKTSKMLI